MPPAHGGPCPRWRRPPPPAAPRLRLSAAVWAATLCAVGGLRPPVVIPAGSTRSFAGRGDAADGDRPFAAATGALGAGGVADATPQPPQYLRQALFKSPSGAGSLTQRHVAIAEPQFAAEPGPEAQNVSVITDEEKEAQEAQDAKQQHESAAPVKGGNSTLIDPAEEWEQVSELHLLLPFVAVFVICFESCHSRWSRVDWSMPVEYPEELSRIPITSIFSGVGGWIREFMMSAEKRGSRAFLLTSLLAFFALQAYLKYKWTMWFGRWYQLLQFPSGNTACFWPLFGNFLTLMAVSTFRSVYTKYLETWFKLDWRTFMTKRFQRLWFSHRAYYLMEVHPTEENHTDNPDQRISEDATKFCDSTYELGMGMLRCAIDLVIYTPMLWKMSPVSVLGYFDCKGWLLYTAMLWACTGCFLVNRVGRILIALNYARQRYNADYRFGLASVRTNSESIAMLRGESAVEMWLGSQWEHIRRVTWEGMVFEKRYSFIMAVYHHTEWALSLVVLVPAYLQGQMTLANMRIAQSALGNVKDDLEFLINSWDTITKWRSSVARLQAFEAHRKKAMGEEALRDGSDLLELGGDNIDVHGLRVRVPSGSLLVAVDNFMVRPGDRVIISGPVGVGKSSLVRALSGIWPHIEVAEDGRVLMPPTEQCLFVPRVPALPAVSLRDMLSYPEPSGTYDDENVLATLESVGLSHLLRATPGSASARPGVGAHGSSAAGGDAGSSAGEGGAEPSTAKPDALGTVADWSKVLSGGEQQRAVIAHALLKAPKFLFLDEATSSMSREASVELYSLLVNRLGSGTAIVSITHDVQGLRPLHTRHLSITPEDRRLKDAESPSEDAPPRAQ